MGRGSSKAANGRSGAPYGSEFKTLHEFSNIKYVTPTSGTLTAPMFTQTQGRVYATIDDHNDVKYITYYDKALNRYKQADIKGRKHIINGKPRLPHVHYGYYHDEHGTFKPTKKEQRLIEKIVTEWYNFNSRK